MFCCTSLAFTEGNERMRLKSKYKKQQQKKNLFFFFFAKTKSTKNIKGMGGLKSGGCKVNLDVSLN